MFLIGNTKYIIILIINMINMGVIAEKRGQRWCDMTAQVVSTHVAWSYSSKLTSK